MRRSNLVITTIICVFFLLVGCQQQAKMGDETIAKEAIGKKGEPKIEFGSLVYDFGKVGPRKKLNGEFKFTNTGDAPLKITKVEKCCGAVTQLDKDELKPGETGTLKVRYTSSSMPNKITKKLYVNTNDKENARVMLTIKAETVLNVTYEPKSMKLMLNEDNAGCPEITIKSVGGKPFSITSFKATSDTLTADIDPDVKATQFVLQPKANIEELKKRNNGRINISIAYSESELNPEVISIIFQSLSRFSFRPTSLVFLYTEQEVPITKYLWVTNNYDEDFEIESAVSESGYIEIIDQKKVGKRYQFGLEITPPRQLERRTFTDKFIVKFKDGTEKTVICRGILRRDKKNTE